MAQLSPTAVLRMQLEQAIDCALALLDQLDGDPDLEPTDGSCSCVGMQGHIDQRAWATGNRDDCEDVSEDEGTWGDDGCVATYENPEDQTSKPVYRGAYG